MALHKSEAAQKLAAEIIKWQEEARLIAKQPWFDYLSEAANHTRTNEQAHQPRKRSTA